ncbi:MAG: hypothetical protein WDM92_14255 [Caulobacteraceae bacterium]
MRRGGWLAACAVGCLALAAPAAGAPARAKAATAHARFDPRALDGSWDHYPAPGDGAVDPTVKPPKADLPPPPLKPEYLGPYLQHQKEVAAANARGEPPVTGYVKCLPDGMPATMMAMFPLEVLQSKGRITIIEEAYNQVRRIYLGEKQVAIDDAEPGFWGHSVGHWEGDTLVVNTVGIKENVKFRDVPHSDRMQIDERIRLVAPDYMEDRITVTDPVYLTGPWSWAWMYKRKPGYKIEEYVCEDNREFPDPDNGSQRLHLLPGQRQVGAVRPPPPRGSAPARRGGAVAADLRPRVARQAQEPGRGGEADQRHDRDGDAAVGQAHVAGPRRARRR